MKTFWIVQVTLVFSAYFTLALWAFDKNNYQLGINSLITDVYVLFLGISCLILTFRNEEIQKLKNEILDKDKEIIELRKLKGYR
jgi:hypothetical protein